MQKPGPRDILCSKARPPGKIYCAKAPGTGSDSDANPWGLQVVIEEIDTCITCKGDKNCLS